MRTIETDYLVVGAGAAGMAFTDALIADSNADVVMVERRHSPGGHWNDAYPFVRLHQPSAIYGVNSRMLGMNLIDAMGCDAGLYERATAAEICCYFQRVLDEVFLSSGQVRFFGMCDYIGDWENKHVFKSRMTGATTQVRVRHKIVDTTYLEATTPATHKPNYQVDEGIQCCPVGEIVNQMNPPSGYTILGGGKTSMDACYWLLTHGIDPDKIRWIRPRDSWVLKRSDFQPLDMMERMLASFANSMEVMANAEDENDLFAHIEACDLMRRLDQSVVPTMFRGAILSDGEFEALKQIKRVVRKGHVKGIGANRIVLEDGTIPTDPRQVHVDCTAPGFRCNPEIPIYGQTRITTQGLVGGFTCFSAALIGYVEAVRNDDAEKNRLLRPVAPLSRPMDWIRVYRGFLQVADLQADTEGAPDIANWMETVRLSATAGMGKRLDNPEIAQALGKAAEYRDSAMENGERLLAGATAVN